jgi:replicative DNA helicase
VGEGGRDATCTRLAGYLLGKNLPPDVVEALLLEWAGRCTPPFPEAEVRKCVASIAKRGGAEPAEPPKRLADVLRFLNTMAGHGAQRRAPTPFLALSHLLSGGFLPGELIYLGARPGLGKTSLALQLARATAEAGQGVLFVSREMTPEALVRRLVAQAGMLRAERFRAGDLDDVERRLLQEACAELAPLPLWVTSDVVTIDEIHDAVRDHEGEALGLVVVDYLQLVRGPSDLRDRRLAVEFVSQGLKSLAVTYRLPVLALSSLARPPREARNYRHGLNDLRESGELEHDADLVLFLHADRENPDNRELTIAKHRDGATGSLALRFQGEYVRFLEV